MASYCLSENKTPIRLRRPTRLRASLCHLVNSVIALGIDRSQGLTVFSSSRRAQSCSQMFFTSQPITNVKLYSLTHAARLIGCSPAHRCLGQRFGHTTNRADGRFDSAAARSVRNHRRTAAAVDTHLGQNGLLVAPQLLKELEPLGPYTLSPETPDIWEHTKIRTPTRQQPQRPKDGRGLD